MTAEELLTNKVSKNGWIRYKILLKLWINIIIKNTEKTRIMNQFVRGMLVMFRRRKKIQDHVG